MVINYYYRKSIPEKALIILIRRKLRELRNKTILACVGQKNQVFYWAGGLNGTKTSHASWKG